MFSQNRWAEQKGYSARPPQVPNEDSSISGSGTTVLEAGRFVEVRANTVW
jgi:hypothetical protein